MITEHSSNNSNSEGNVEYTINRSKSKSNEKEIDSSGLKGENGGERLDMVG